MVTQLSGKIYPDESFTVGVVPFRNKPNDKDNEYERLLKAQEEYLLQREPDQPNRFIKSQELSQDAKTSKKNLQKYGGKGITGYGRKIASNLPLLIEQKFTKKKTGFFTATLPLLEEGELRIVNSYWSEIVRRFFQELKREYARKGEHLYYLAVTEIQEKRYARTNQPYPHLHWVAPSKKTVKGEFIVSADWLRSTWRRIVVAVLRLHGCNDGVIGSISFRASIDAQAIKVSAAAYLGKYLSKGSKVVKRMQEHGYAFPGQWWSADSKGKRLFRQSIAHLSQEDCKTLFYNFHQLLEANQILYGSVVEIETDRGVYQVGVGGRLGKILYQYLYLDTHGLLEHDKK